MNKYTVIGHYEESGQIFMHHVIANTPEGAFYLCAELHPSAEFTCCLPGHLKEGFVTFPGAGLVDSNTILEQTTPAKGKVLTGDESNAHPTSVAIPVAVNDGQGNVINGTVTATEQAVCVSFDGYTDATSAPDKGDIVSIDCYNGAPRVAVFGDVHSEDPTDVIELCGAANPPAVK